MRGRFIMKHIDNRKPQKKATQAVAPKKVVEVKKAEQPKEKTEAKAEVKEDKDKKKTEEVMTTSEKIAMAQNVLNDSPKRIKKDKGLIERTESSRTILTEDNKELLKD